MSSLKFGFVALVLIFAIRKMVGQAVFACDQWGKNWLFIRNLINVTPERYVIQL